MSTKLRHIYHSNLMTVTRDNQRVDEFYQLEDGSVFVTTDGEGRLWYDNLEEALEQHELEGVNLVHHVRSSNVSDF